MIREGRPDTPQGRPSRPTLRTDFVASTRTDALRPRVQAYRGSSLCWVLTPPFVGFALARRGVLDVGTEATGRSGRLS